MKKWIYAYFVIIFTALGLDLYVVQDLSFMAEVIAVWLGGCLFFGFGWFFYFYEYEFFRRAIIVPGTIDAYYGKRKFSSYSVLVSFSLNDTMQTVRSGVLSFLPPSIGSICEVGVDPANISRIRIRSGKWFFPFFCFMFTFPGFLALVSPVFPQ
ncbi:MAG: hypothetical protein IKP96_01970 [Elusimicrobiaceae bacterium]|nr:hypothetical protein [Elusimicrobiaceae bacterium]